MNCSRCNRELIIFDDGSYVCEGCGCYHHEHGTFYPYGVLIVHAIKKDILIPVINDNDLNNVKKPYGKYHKTFSMFDTVNNKLVISQL